MRILTEKTLDSSIDWSALMEAIVSGHKRPQAKIGDTLLEQGSRKYLSRSAWIEGLGACTKSVTIYPENPLQNPALPSVQGQLVMFDEATGAPIAILDGPAETRLKTAADSALGSRLLSRENSELLLMVGAGNMSRPLIDAHMAARPSLKKVLIWNRSDGKSANVARAIAETTEIETEAVSQLDEAIPEADIICCATMCVEPIIKGALLSLGTHVDLVGAYTPDMREADNEALKRSRLFADSFHTTLDHIGEYKIPLAGGVIQRTDVLADFYGLIDGSDGRLSNDDITLFKNGGGAHLDLMIAHHLANN
ncbi:MAG: ornithine cyclodeaminase family protein [Hyphomicrobiales bacterium]